MANSQNTQPNDATAKIGNAAQNNTENKTKNTGTTNQSATSNNQLADKVGNIISGDTGAVKDVLNQAKESTGQVASQAYGIAAEKATSKIDEQKTNLAQGLTSVADSIRKMGENLRGSEQTGVAGVTAKYSDSIATQVEQLSGYLDRKDLRELSSDVERFARRNPAVFLGGAFALGLLAARFLKSGNPNQALMRRPRREEGGYLPDRSQDTNLSGNLGNQLSSTGSRKDFTTDTSKTKDFTTGVSDTKDFNSGVSGTKDSTTDVSGTKNTTTGTSGTTNTNVGSSNKGG
jgi:hypothetical protein